ncbi:MAG: aminotransferase class V-fold PLP-dependent enzyme [Candidatus Altiarchaeota archaeon]
MSKVTEKDLANERQRLTDVLRKIALKADMPIKKALDVKYPDPEVGTLNYALARSKIVPTKDVCPHEETIEAAVWSIRNMMVRTESSDKPIIVTSKRKNGETIKDPKTGRTKYVILDGMHRSDAMKRTGCEDSLVFDIDYEREAELHGWDEIVEKSKQNSGVSILNVVKDTVETMNRDSDRKFKVVEGDDDIKTLHKLMDPKRGMIAFGVIDDKGRSYKVTYKDDSELALKDIVKVMNLFDEKLREKLESVDDNPNETVRFFGDDKSADEFKKNKSLALITRPRFSKEEVVEMALKGEKVPMKTTRHIFKMRPHIRVPLKLLQDKSVPYAAKTRQLHEAMENARYRYYPEGILDFADIDGKLDVSDKYLGKEEMERKRQELLDDRNRDWAKEFKQTHEYRVAGSTKDVYHRSPEFQELYKSVEGGIKWLLNPKWYTTQDKSQAFIINAETTVAMGRAALYSLSEGERILHIDAGTFGKRWHNEINNESKIRSNVFEIIPGTKITEEILANLKKEIKDGGYSAVTAVHNETSTGMELPISTFSKVIKEVEKETGREILFLVDAASSLGGMPIPNVEDIDVLISGIEKCFQCNAGLSLIVMRSRALEKAKKSILYKGGTGFERLKEYADKNQTVGTPEYTQIKQLHEVLCEIGGYISLDGRYYPGEGVEKRYERIKDLARVTEEWAEKSGFGLFAPEGFRSSTVTTITTAGMNVSPEIVKDRIKANFGIELSPGHRELKEKEQKIDLLRVTHFGAKGLPELVDKELNLISIVVKDEIRQKAARGEVIGEDAASKIGKLDAGIKFLMDLRIRRGSSNITLSRRQEVDNMRFEKKSEAENLGLNPNIFSRDGWPLVTAGVNLDRLNEKDKERISYHSDLLIQLGAKTAAIGADPKVLFEESFHRLGEVISLDNPENFELACDIGLKAVAAGVDPNKIFTYAHDLKGIIDHDRGGLKTAIHQLIVMASSVVGKFELDDVYSASVMGMRDHIKDVDDLQVVWGIVKKSAESNLNPTDVFKHISGVSTDVWKKKELTDVSDSIIECHKIGSRVGIDVHRLLESEIIPAGIHKSASALSETFSALSTVLQSEERYGLPPRILIENALPAMSHIIAKDPEKFVKVVKLVDKFGQDIKTGGHDINRAMRKQEGGLLGCLDTVGSVENFSELLDLYRLTLDNGKRPKDWISHFSEIKETLTTEEDMGKILKLGNKATAAGHDPAGLFKELSKLRKFLSDSSSIDLCVDYGNAAIESGNNPSASFNTIFQMRGIAKSGDHFNSLLVSGGEMYRGGIPVDLIMRFGLDKLSDIVREADDIMDINAELSGIYSKVHAVGADADGVFKDKFQKITNLIIDVDGLRMLNREFAKRSSPSEIERLFTDIRRVKMEYMGVDNIKDILRNI